MSGLREDDAVEIISEINYSSISGTHVLKGFKFTAIGVIKPSEFGRWTRVRDIGDDFKSEQVRYPKNKKTGILFEKTGEHQTDVFLPLHSTSALLKSDPPERGPKGNTEHCMFCVKDSTAGICRIEWPLDSTYTIHRDCLEKFKKFIENLVEEHKEIILTHHL